MMRSMPCCTLPESIVEAYDTPDNSPGFWTNGTERGMSKVARLEVIPIAALVQTADDLDGTTETVIVKVFDEDGRCGIGETDAPPEVVKSFLEMRTAHLWSRNMSEILIGSDPIELAANWQRMYEGVCWPGRRGLGMHALSAVDVALH